MAFKVRASRNDDGNYTLSYGKGRNKLAGRLLRGASNVWTLEGLSGVFTRKRGAIAAWHQWAVTAYGGQNSTSSEPEPALASDPEPESPNDELSNHDRGLFANLAVKHGQLTEWQRSQCRLVLRRLCGLSENPTDKVQDEPKPKRSGPPPLVRPAVPSRATENPAGEAPPTDDSPADDGPEPVVSGVEEVDDAV